MLDWNDFRYFLAVHRAGTLARAASALGINSTTVSRRLSALEDAIQARVFVRTPEGYTLTRAGQDLLPQAELMELATLKIEREVAGSDLRAAGTVRISTTEMIATRLIAPGLQAFAERYPELTIELACSLHLVSLPRREADIALRLVRPVEENVVARKLTSFPVALYASHAYVSTHGRPADPEQTLAGQRVIMFADNRIFAAENAWLLARADGASSRLRSDSVSAIYAATVAGAGIALLPRRLADQDPALTRLDTLSAPEPRAIWSATHEAVQHSARVRAVLAFLAEVLEPPAGDP